jgi:hypothetical protein
MDCPGVFLCAWGSIKTLDCSVIKCVLSVSLHEIQWGAGLSLVIQKEEEDSR